MAGVKISALPGAATLNVADLLEVSQSISSVQTSGKVTLAALATFLGATIVGSINLSTVLLAGNTSSGTPINMNDNDEIQLGNSRYGVLMYKSAFTRVELKNTNSNDYLYFLDGNGISLNTAGILSQTATGAINLTSNASGVNLATTTNYLSVLEGIGIVSATNSNTTGFSIGESTNIFRLFAGTELRLDAATTTLYQLTANTVPYLGASKEFVSSAVTPTELGYVSGVTSAIQTQINALQTGQFWKQACRVATTVPGTLATSFENGDTIDGVVLATNDRILIKDQSSAVENGIYVVNASGAPTRATDFDAQADNLSGATVTIQEGTANAEKKFTCSTNNPITIGVTNITFIDAGGLAYLGTTNRITVSGNVIDIAATYVGQTSITTLGTVGTGTWQATSISTTYTDAKIKGAIAASNRIAFGSGVADTLTDSANITYNGTTLSVLGYLTVATTSIPFSVNSTNSNINKLQFTDNGTSRGYLGASSLYCFTAYESTGAAMRVGVTSAGNLLVGPISSGGTDIVGEFLRTTAATAQVRLTNASASNGAYVQYTLINNATVVNLGLVGGGTTTSGVYVQGQAYNMTSSGGWSFGTLNAAGVVRVYGGNGVLSFTVDSSSNIEVADAKNIIFNTSTGTKIGTATTQKLSFWNKTPIVQPTTGITGATLVSNAGTAITSTDTFGGYTLQQLAAVIINTGLAA